MRYSCLGYRDIPNEIAIEVENGILYIRKDIISLMPLDDKNRRYKFAVAYDPKAKSRVFMAALRAWFPDEKCRIVFRKHIADALFQTNGCYSGKVLHVLDRSGKAADDCFACIRPLFRDFATSVPLLGLCNNKEECHGVGQLKNSLLNISVDKGFEIFDVEVLRSLINARPKPIRTTLMDSFTVSPPKFIFSTETISHSLLDHGLCSNIDCVSISMDQSLEKAHTYLAKIIVARELPGILNWVLEGVQYIFAENERCQNSRAR